jgi:hypothetical protein
MKDDIKKLLPDINNQRFEEIKKESPYAVLNLFASAVNDKYNKKITARVVETIKTIKTSTGEETDNPAFAFYLEAPIGKGYLYRLIEVQQVEKTLYPIKVTLFEKEPSVLGVFTNYTDFLSEMGKLFSTGFVSTIILNLIGQVDLYNESRQIEW